MGDLLFPGRISLIPTVFSHLSHSYSYLGLSGLLSPNSKHLASPWREAPGTGGNIWDVCADAGICATQCSWDLNSFLLETYKIYNLNKYANLVVLSEN